MPPSDDEIDMVIPGMPTPGGAATSRAPDQQPTRSSGRARSSSGGRGRGAVELPTANPYAGERRVPMNHRVYQTFPQQLAELSQQLIDAGYSPRQASQAELLQMILHDSMPQSVEEAARRMQLWAMVKAAPPAPR